MGRSAVLTRKPSTEQGTFGSIQLDTGITFLTAELPWKNNERLYSCIPEGTYTCTWRRSFKRGFCYFVDDVPGRDAIEFHPANFAGDVKLGYRSELLGCIALGTSFQVVYWQTTNPVNHDQIAIFGSRDAVSRFEHEMKHQTFTLTIQGENHASR
jgi:hypothetical protein